MNTKERLDNIINGLHNAVAESYEKGYSDASKEILGEAIHALELRGNCDVAIAVIKGLMK